MTDQERANVVTNIERIGKLYQFGPDITFLVKMFGSADIAEHLPELKQSPQAVSDNDLKMLGHRLSDVFTKIASKMQ